MYRGRLCCCGKTKHPNLNPYRFFRLVSVRFWESKEKQPHPPNMLFTQELPLIRLFTFLHIEKEGSDTKTSYAIKYPGLGITTKKNRYTTIRDREEPRRPRQAVQLLIQNPLGSDSIAKKGRPESCSSAAELITYRSSPLQRKAAGHKEWRHATKALRGYLIRKSRRLRWASRRTTCHSVPGSRPRSGPLAHHPRPLLNAIQLNPNSKDGGGLYLRPPNRSTHTSSWRLASPEKKELGSHFRRYYSAKSRGMGDQAAA